MIIERFDHFEPGQHPVHPVEFAARRLSVEMAPRHDHRQGVVASRAPDEQVPHRIDSHAATGVPIHITGITIIRIAGGKMVEGWQNWDMLGLMEQIQGMRKSATYVAAG